MGKRILIIGSGGREHALAWKVSESSHVDKIYVAPGNGGTQKNPKTKNVPIKATNIKELADFARKEKIDLTIVGPEDPLADGIVDLFRRKGLKIFGPAQLAAKLESSKVFAKKFMKANEIPTATFRIFNNYEKAFNYIESKDAPIVIKASGLADGKGVYVCKSLPKAQNALKRIFIDREFGNAGNRIVIEELLEGFELSIHVFCDGKNYKIMPPSQDHKPIFDGDKGPNTGGMGAYASVPWVNKKLLSQIEKEILRPTIKGLIEIGAPFVGCLYLGLMITPGGPKVLEFNVRFGDPETQPLIMLLETDLVDIAEACINGELDKINISWSDSYAVCLILASEGYPNTPKIGREIYNLELIDYLPESNINIFHAGTVLKDKRFFTSGGRVLGITATGIELEYAIKKAYEIARIVWFENMQLRNDIGAKAFITI